MQNQLQKVINLSKKTGDKVIVFDSENPDLSYVVMPFEEYEKLAEGRAGVKGLTEGELIDKINRDIAMWKNHNDFADAGDYFYFNGDKDKEKSSETSKNSGSAEKEKMQLKKIIKKNNWSIPKEIKEAAEEVMEEDRQYLEEAPY